MILGLFDCSGMPGAIIVGSLELAAKGTAIYGEKIEDFERLERVAAGKNPAQLEAAIGVMVDSYKDGESNFAKVMDLLIGKVRGGEGVFKRCVIDSKGPKAAALINHGFKTTTRVIDFIVEAQRSDLMSACREGSEKDISQAIKSIGPGIARRVTDEGGQTGFHVAVTNPNAQIDTFLGYGFDLNAQDAAGVTPYMLLCRNKAAVAAAILKNKDVDDPDFLKQDSEGKRASDYCAEGKLKTHLQKRESMAEKTSQDKDAIYAKRESVANVPASSVKVSVAVSFGNQAQMG